MAKQCIFGWFDSMLGQESEVVRLLRWTPERGLLKSVSYGQWQRFYSPLSSRGVPAPVVAVPAVAAAVVAEVKPAARRRRVRKSVEQFSLGM